MLVLDLQDHIGPCVPLFAAAWCGASVLPNIQHLITTCKQSGHEECAQLVLPRRVWNAT